MWVIIFQHLCLYGEQHIMHKNIRQLCTIITELNSLNHCKIRHSEVITTSVIWREEKICQNTCFLGTPKQILSPKALVFRAFYTIPLSCIMRRTYHAQFLRNEIVENVVFSIV